MSRRTLLVVLLAGAVASALAAAAEPTLKKYTPEVHGMLTSGKQPVSSNVCLRQGDSEIRSCGYADANGRFFISSSGPLHSAGTKSDGRPEETLPKYWLETGNVQSAQKLWPIDLVANPFVAIEIDCDLSRAAQADPAFRNCETKAAKQLIDHVPRDDTPYRMPRSAKTPER